MTRPAVPSAILMAHLLAGAAFAGTLAGSNTVTVAVAANFTAAAREIAAAFEDATGDGALLSFGSTGQLYAQILQGAPFEVFLAADEARPELAERDGLAVPGSRRTYAVGRLVLFSAEAGRVTGPDALRDPGLRRIALANPALAPYGRAALEASRALGVEDVVRGRQVIGTNVSQAHQFVRTGNAELGFLALSQVVRSTEGSRWLVPEHLHAPIRQQAVLLEAGRENSAAARFLEFLGSVAAREVLRRHGYRTEPAAPPGSGGP
ncbi:MAG: molybdate ABC transporter substrate-binding protein [Acidobacteriota bacterium]|nr:molybdate ABC transporter substrate-binding protein [Acidobacteriota bacterium]MDE2710359.1 molybdate ABC transporter substrate-binding protein [Acidobacteriota bacterium]MXW70441.1 molybdate ABC transporter substrate-binding protein [Acidobacteriota bacterium]MXX86111.1 molybdate ABC transporter substrate-binding protein [Acidobacteriota bacterium]MYE42806.1 molybdate ABC transporter substrate-binding protein [Acidobacteriota bacterium]